MIYYDRRLPAPLLAKLHPSTGPLRWLVDLVRSPWGAEHLAHIQFRRAASTRASGGIQVYLGRTSPLEIVAKPKDSVEMRAERAYRGVSPDLFGRWIPGVELAGLHEHQEAHLRCCAEGVTRSFLDGEALAHAGMMRRYGLRHVPGDPLVAVDSEVQLGFASTVERTQFEEELRARFHLTKGGIPRKLDMIGLLPSGDIALVEIKEEKGDIVRAAVQVGAHMTAMSRLRLQEGNDLHEVLNGTVSQKVKVGLIPETSMPVTTPGSKLVPIIAAPVATGDTTWAERWLRATASVRLAHPGLIDGLRLWRLSSSGEVLEEVAA